MGTYGFGAGSCTVTDALKFLLGRSSSQPAEIAHTRAATPYRVMNLFTGDFPFAGKQPSLTLQGNN